MASGRYFLSGRTSDDYKIHVLRKVANLTVVVEVERDRRSVPTRDRCRGDTDPCLTVSENTVNDVMGSAIMRPPRIG